MTRRSRKSKRRSASRPLRRSSSRSTRSLFGEIQKALEKLADERSSRSRKEFDKKNVRTADFAKKLMGQIVFLYFIQKKGWLGVEKGKDWGTGPHDFLRRLARGEYGKYENFFNDILEPLFYDTLDQKLVDCFASSRKVLGYEVNFDFEIYFSEVFHRKSGFDVVIANPPYVSKNALQKQSAELLKLLRASYETAKGRDFDLFGCFIEKGIAILRPKGTLTFIVASGWYTGPGFGALRRFVACKTDPLVFINLPYDMFSAAWVDTTILILTRRTLPTNWPREISCRVRLRNFDKREKITGRKDFERQLEVVDITDWFTSDSDLFLTRSTPRIIGLIRRIEANCRPLGELADVQRGVTPFELTEKPVNRHSKRAFAGTVRRYVLDLGATRFIRFDRTLAEPKPERYFIGPRILLRELISRQFRLQATFTDEDFVTNKSMQTVLSLSDGPSLKYLLGCINSTLISWLFLQRSNVGHRDDFPKIVLKETRALPIPDGTKDQQLKIVRLVDRILAAKQQDAEANTRPLEQNIDELVYPLYGLTPEEIEIVESVK